MDNSALSILKRGKIYYRPLFYALIPIIMLLLFLLFLILKTKDEAKETLNVGVLFSQTGAMADTERPALKATLMAIEEINNKGGVNGQLIKPIVYDPGSVWTHSSQLATKMIKEDHVISIFGCFTSASRKEVKDVVEKYNNLLIYPVSYEGAETSPNIIYLGMTPNQQIIPAVSWILNQNHKKIYLVGSDYIWPRISNEIISKKIQMMGGQVVGINYIPLGSTKVKMLIDDIIAKKPDAIFSTIIGTSNIAFLNRLYDKIPSSQMPEIMSFGIMPLEEFKNRTSKFVGLTSVWSYSKTLDNPENKLFLKAYQTKYGSIQDIDDPAATAYAGVYLWAQALKGSHTNAPEIIKNLMLRQSIASPGGVMYIDPANANTWRSVFIEKINQNGERKTIWSSLTPIEPVVFPDFKTKAEWELFEHELYTSWDNSWQKSLNY